MHENVDTYLFLEADCVFDCPPQESIVAVLTQFAGFVIGAGGAHFFSLWKRSDGRGWKEWKPKSGLLLVATHGIRAGAIAVFGGHACQALLYLVIVYSRRN